MSAEQARVRRDRKDRIFIYGMNYAPEMTGVGRYSGELGSWLAASGREVEVVTAPPHYPGWWVRPPYSSGRYERDRVDNAIVWRCPVWLSRSASGLRRLIAPLSFALSSAPFAFWRIIRSRPNAVLCVEPTIAIAPVALLAARLAGARTVLHVQDLEFDAAIAVGHVKGPKLLQRMLFGIEAWLLGQFDRIVTISTQMAARLEEKGVDRERMTLIRNWVDTGHLFPIAGTSPYRAELGIAESDYVLLYSGQIGAKQSLHLLFDAAEALADVPGIHFVVAGEGPLKPRYVERYGHLPNLTLLPLQPEARFNEFLNLADCHLLPQDPAVAELVLPSKLGGMLATGKRILVTASRESEIGTFLGDAASFAAPGELADTIQALAAEGPVDPAPALSLARSLGLDQAMAAFERVLLGRADSGADADATQPVAA